MDIGIPELLIILLIVLLLFGSTRLPKLSHSVGEAMRELRNGLTGSDATSKNKEAKAKENPPETNTPKITENVAEVKANPPVATENVAEPKGPLTETKENTTEA